MGSFLFWFENWTRLGSLYFLMNQDFAIEESVNNVYEVLKEDSWDVERLMEILPEEYVMHIVEMLSHQLYKMYWINLFGC